VSSEAKLLRAVGSFGLAAAIVNIMIGGGIYRLPAVVAESLGAGAWIAYLVCAVVMGLIGLVIAEAGSRVSVTGGPYAYVEIAFGPFAGFMTGVMNWLIGYTAIAAVATVFIDGLGALVPFFASVQGRATGLVLAFAFLAVVNVLGVKHGARLNSITTVVKILPLFVLILFGVWAVDPANLSLVETPAPATIARTSIVLLFAFTGVESALVLGGELKDPSRTVPRGILFGLGFVTLVYLSVQFVAQGILGPALAGSPTPLADAAAAGIGPWARTVLLVGVVISTFGYLSGMALASPRAIYAFGRDGFLPKVVGAVHPSFHTPWVAVVLQLGTVCLVAITSTFGTLAVISNVAALLVYLGCAAGAWQLRRMGIQEPGTTPFRVPGGLAVPVIASVAIIFLLTSITGAEWRVLGYVAAAATLIFFATKKAREAKAQNSSSPIE
jgi:APA family basic amino acid/polyamine antiporter